MPKNLQSGHQLNLIYLHQLLTSEASFLALEVPLAFPINLCNYFNSATSKCLSFT